MNGKVILVTGASGGLGGALARHCAARGATVVLMGKTVSKLESVYDSIVEAGGAEPFIMPLDYTQAAVTAFSEIGSAVVRECGRLDALVHCAASLGMVSPIEQQTAEALRATWLVNVMGPMMLTRALSPALRAARAPRIVFVTDSHVTKPGPFWGGYGVSKAAIDHFAQTLSLEWDFARVHTYVPGAIDSPLRQQTHPGEAKAQRKPLEEAVLALAALLDPA